MSDKDESKRKEGFMKFNTDNLQLHLIKVEKHLTKNGTGFLVGDSVYITLIKCSYNNSKHI